MKTALITGASQGIGAAIADKLNDKKIKVILVSRSKSKLKSFQKNLKFPKNSLIISKDLRSLSACNSIAKRIKKLDYLINVAGATKGGKFLNLNDNIWEDGFNLKFKATVRLSRAFWPALKRSKGKVIRVYPKLNRALVEGVNMISKHTKPNAENPQGGIIKKEAPIHISNLMLVDPKTGEPTKIGRKKDDKTGKIVRFSKKSGELI